LYYNSSLLLVGCTAKDAGANKDNLNGFDYRLFEGTPAWKLAKAVEDENVDVIKSEISKNKSSLHFRDPKFGQTLLQMAVQTQKFKSVETLADLGADPNLQDKYDGSSALMEAAKVYDELKGGPDPRYLKLLLKHGGDPNAEEKTIRRNGNYTRNTPLINACNNRALEYVKILVNAGANVNYLNDFGESALSTAVLVRNPDIVLYLLNRKADFRHPMMTIEPSPLLNQTKTKYVYIIGALKYWRFKKGSVEDSKNNKSSIS
jgi:ankyrin repeat protein